MRRSQRVHQHRCELSQVSVVETLLPNEDNWHRRLKKAFLLFYTVNPNLPWTDRYLKSQAEVREEQHKHLYSYPWTIHPLSTFSVCWNTFMILVYSLLYCEIPLRYFALLSDKPMNFVDIVIVFVLSVTNLLDIVIHIVRGRISSEKNLLQIELNMRKNFKKYLREFFVLDVVATVPYLLSFYGNIYQAGENMWINRMAHHLTILRMMRLGTFCRYVGEFLRVCGAGDNAVDITLLIALAVVMCHTLVTVQILPGALQADLLGLSYADSWIEAAALSEKPAIEQYVISLYRGVQLLMGGGYQRLASHITAGQLTSVAIMVFGSMVRAVFMAKILEMLLRTRSHLIKHEEMMNQLSNYLEVKRFPTVTRKKFKRFFEERQVGSYFREERIMDSLPNTLRNEVLLHNMRILLERVAFLRELPSTQFEWLIQRLEQEIVLPNTEIYKFKERGDCMYFVASGTLALYSPSDIELGHITDGDVLGVQALVMQEEMHLMTVITLETCELYRLSQDDFQKLIEHNPSLLKSIEAIAMERFELVRTTELLIELRRSSNLDRIPQVSDQDYYWMSPSTDSRKRKTSFHR